MHIPKHNIFVPIYCTPGEGTPILGYGREVPRWWSMFLRFLIWLDPYFMADQHLIHPFYCREISLSLSHEVPEILGPKVGQIFHQNVWFNSFWAFCINFFLDFRSNWLPFSLILHLLTPHFYKTLDLIGCNVLLHAELPTKTLVNYSPPGTVHVNDVVEHRNPKWVLC